MAILDKKNVRLGFPERLQEGIKVWQKMAEPTLKHRNKMLGYDVNGYFSSSDEHSLRPINLTDRGVNTITPYLVMGNPSVIVNTRIPQLQPWALTTQLAIGHLLNEIDFASRTLRPAVRNSMFGAGIVKTAIMHEEEVEIAGYKHDLGQPYCDVIDDSDYVGDASAKNREMFDFEGHRYLLPTEYAKEFFPKYADSISADYKLYGDNSPDTISRKEIRNDYRTLKDYSEFYDLWLPREGVIVTILPPDRKTGILRTVEWDGPEDGPFDMLGYKFFPGSPIPIPPAWGWVDMDTMLNVLVRKMRTQAEREKSVLAYESVAAEDVERITLTPDGGTVKVENIDRLKEVKSGGVNPGNYQWVQYIEAMYAKQYTNMDIAGGRSSQGGTLGQEQMLQANSGRILEDMAIQVHNFTKKIITKMAWFLWTDPLIQLPLVKRVPETQGLEVIFSQQEKEGDFWDFNFDIEPYSMQRHTPDARYQKMMQLLSQWILPVSQMAAQQGNQLNIDQITRQLAMYLDVKNLDNWWTSEVPSNGAGLNAYQPTQGTVVPKSGVTDGRTGEMGVASRNANLQQQQARAGGQSSKKE